MEKSSDTQKNDKILPQVIEDEMKNSYLNYSMSVIVGRALPDVRDGLKPVHRRILYAMNDMGMLHNKPFKKSARIVGEVLGKYHPHGDSAVYESMVRMVQEFSLRYPLIDGQGNFGSIDGDSAAAMRYCVTGDSLILTDEGILPISSISDKKEALIDMKIQSYNSKKNSATKFFNSGKHDIIQLETNLGYKISGSYNHPIMCWGIKQGIPQIQWKLLEEITKKDITILNRNSSLFSKQDLDLRKYNPKLRKRAKKFSLPSKMNKKLAFLFGALVSEGSFHQGKIIFNNSNMDYYDNVKNIIYDLFEGVQLYERRVAGNCLELDLYHTHIVDFLKNIGLKEAKSDKKEIPFSVLLSSKNVLGAFLQGLFEGDGSVMFKQDKRHGGKSIELTYNSKSSKLIEQLKIVLLNFGVVTTRPYTDKRNNCYKLIISGFDSIKRFKDEIDFFSERKKEILANIGSMNSYRMSKTDFIPYLNNYLRGKYDNSFILRNNFDRYNNLEKNYVKLVGMIDNNDKKLINSILKNKYLFNKVKTVDKLSAKEVFSLKVDSNCHSFVANGFINHNTEARLDKKAEEMLEDINKETVDFVPNFDGSLKEPTVLPSKLPNLLINGSSGIAVGMATNMPPHNISEVIDGAMAVIDNPNIEFNELLDHIHGPDFPTAGIISGRSGIIDAYKTGRGRVIIKAKYEIESDKNRIILTELPYQVNKSVLIIEIASCVREKKIDGLSDIRDESDRRGIRVVIELKRDANPDIVINKLFKYTRMKVTFGVINLALIDNVPKVLTLKEILENYVVHRREIVTRRTQFDLRKAEDKAHILEGLKIALDNIDEVISLIKKADSVEKARSGLIESFSLSEKQAQAILDMRLQKLTSLEQGKIKQDLRDTLALIDKLKSVLASESEILKIIKDELGQLKERYGDKRRTEIVNDAESDIEIEDLIKREDVVVTVTHHGYVKRVPLETYKQQGRGGRGIIGTGKKEEDFVEDLFIANTHDYLLFFSNKGKVYWLKVYELPEGSRQSKGRPIVNLLSLDQGEKINAFIKVAEFSESHFLIMATKNGLIKKTSLSAYSKPRKGGIIAVNLVDGDELVNVKLTDGNQQIIVATSLGKAAKFKESDIRAVGRSAKGVKGITLAKDDEIIGFELAPDDKTLLCITKNGYGKRSPLDDYRLIKRGGKGVINIKTSSRNGSVVDVKTVDINDEVMLISKQGIIIRMPIRGVSVIGRNTQGVRLMKLADDDEVVSAAKIVSDADRVEE